MMNCVDKIENKLQHISDKILFTCGYGISLSGLVISNCRYIDRTDLQLTTSSNVFQIKLDNI